MTTISKNEFLQKINNNELIPPTMIDNIVEVEIKSYQPYICTAIHAGHNLRNNLESNCFLSSDERKQEEDIYTDVLIKPFPITLIGKDSRYEYDLNRSPDECLYKTAWKKKVWKKSISKRESDISIAKHNLYYEILDALIKKIQKDFGKCLIFDIHSYNWKIRTFTNAPVFNIGTAPINLRHWRKLVDSLKKELQKIKLPNISTTVECDKVFQGKGYQGIFIQKFSSNTVLIPLEIKKIFMDEITGEAFPIVLDNLQKHLYKALTETAKYFSKTMDNVFLKRPHITIDPIVKNIDNTLYNLCKNLEVLSFINPINLHQEYRNFIKKKDYKPQFRYKQIKINPYHFREQLYSLPLSKIVNPLLRKLYASVVDNYAGKIDLLTSIGTTQFFYNSQKYYGLPSSNDIEKANFLLHAPEVTEFKNELSNISPEEAKKEFSKILNQYNIDFKIVLSDKLVAKAMVDNGHKTIYLNKNIKLTFSELQALIHHEFGVHVLTTVNSWQQPLKLLRLGLPGNTATQEGLAIFSEYLSGNLSISRLKVLALRALAINMMIKGEDFNSVFNNLVLRYHQSEYSAFTITSRIFRGGGFTKDALYLTGFREIISLIKTQNINSLFLGKTSSNYLPILNELTENGVFFPCKYIPPAFEKKTKSSTIIDYIVKALE